MSAGVAIRHRTGRWEGVCDGARQAVYAGAVAPAAAARAAARAAGRRREFSLINRSSKAVRALRLRLDLPRFSGRVEALSLT